MCYEVKPTDQPMSGSTPNAPVPLTPSGRAQQIPLAGNSTRNERDALNARNRSWVRMASRSGFSIRVNGPGIASLVGGGVPTGASMVGIPGEAQPIIVVDHDDGLEYAVGAVQLEGIAWLSFSGTNEKLVTTTSGQPSSAYVWLYTSDDLLVLVNAMALAPQTYDAYASPNVD